MRDTLLFETHRGQEGHADAQRRIVVVRVASANRLERVRVHHFGLETKHGPCWRGIAEDNVGRARGRWADHNLHRDVADENRDAASTDKFA